MLYFIQVNPDYESNGRIDRAPFLATPGYLLNAQDMGNWPLSYASRADAEADIELWEDRKCNPFYMLSDGERDRPRMKVVTESRLSKRLRATI